MTHWKESWRRVEGRYHLVRYRQNVTILCWCEDVYDGGREHNEPWVWGEQDLVKERNLKKSLKTNLRYHDGRVTSGRTCDKCQNCSQDQGCFYLLQPVSSITLIFTLCLI